jgi:hypothetical protein
VGRTRFIQISTWHKQPTHPPVRPMSLPQGRDSTGLSTVLIKLDRALELSVWLEANKYANPDYLGKLLDEALRNDSFACAEVLMKHPLLPIDKCWDFAGEDLEYFVKYATMGRLSLPVRKKRRHSFEAWPQKRKREGGGRGYEVPGLEPSRQPVLPMPTRMACLRSPGGSRKRFPVEVAPPSPSDLCPWHPKRRCHRGHPCASQGAPPHFSRPHLWC